MSAPRLFGLLAGLLLVLRAGLSLWLWHDAGGYFWLTGDDAARTQLAYTWSVQPYFNIPGNVWLPLGFWVHGAALKLVMDPLAVSALVNTAFSVISLVFVHRIAITLFPDEPAGALVAVAMAAFTPLVVWLGLSGLSEPIYHFFLLAGLAAWLMAHRDDAPSQYLAAGLSILGASMVRLEAWLLVGLFGLYCGWRSWRHPHGATVLGSAVLGGLFIPAWLWWHWQAFGDPLRFAAVPQAADAGGLGASDLGLFVSLLWANSPLVLALAPIGLWCAWRSRRVESRPLWRPYLWLVVVFGVGFAAATRGRLASNMPIRNLTAIFLMLVPLSAYGVACLARGLRRPAVAVVVAALALAGVGTVRAFDYHFQAGDAAVRAAIWLRQRLNAGMLDPAGDKVLIEVRRGGAAERLVVWDSLFLHAVQPHYTVYDRRPRLVPTADTWVLSTQDNPSILDGAVGEVRARLRARRVRIVAAYSAASRQVLDGIMTRVVAGVSEGPPPDYILYRWPEEQQFASGQ